MVRVLVRVGVRVGVRVRDRAEYPHAVLHQSGPLA